MALYNEILVGRFNRALQKLFGMKGSTPSPQLASEISVMFPLRSGVEDLFSHGWERFGATGLQSPVVGQQSVMRLRNPATSNVIAVVESILFASSLADASARLGNIGTSLDFANPAANRFLDTRTRPTSALIATTGSQASDIANPFMAFQVTALGPSIQLITTENQEIPIPPGLAVEISSHVVNVAITVAMIWRERFLEESERS